MPHLASIQLVSKLSSRNQKFSKLEVQKRGINLVRIVKKSSL